MAEKDKIVAIGPQEEISGLRSVGIELRPAAGGPDLAERLGEACADPQVRLVLISETIAGEAEQLVAEQRREGSPIMLLPSYRGSMGLTLEWLQRGMEQSIGVNVLRNE